MEKEFELLRSQTKRRHTVQDSCFVHGLRSRLIMIATQHHPHNIGIRNRSRWHKFEHIHVDLYGLVFMQIPDLSCKSCKKYREDRWIWTTSMWLLLLPRTFSRVQTLHFTCHSHGWRNIQLISLSTLFWPSTRANMLCARVHAAVCALPSSQTKRQHCLSTHMMSWVATSSTAHSDGKRQCLMPCDWRLLSTDSLGWLQPSTSQQKIWSIYDERGQTTGFYRN